MNSDFVSVQSEKELSIKFQMRGLEEVRYGSMLRFWPAWAVYFEPSYAKLFYLKKYRLSTKMVGTKTCDCKMIYRKSLNCKYVDELPDLSIIQNFDISCQYIELSVSYGIIIISL
jgi:hypothetical protein